VGFASSDRMGSGMQTARQEWAAHWRVVLGVAIAYAVGYSALSSLTSLFVGAMSRDFGVSRGTISAYSALGLMGAISAPFIGRLADRYGVRKVAGTCFASLALIYVAMGLQSGAITTFILLMTCFGVFGVGTGGLILTRAINSWFVQSRGLALSVSLAGLSLVNLALAPVMGWVIETWSWREGYFLLSALTACVGLPVIYWLVHERRDDGKMLANHSPSASAGRQERVWFKKDFVCLAAALVIMNIPGPDDD
jgi:MFS family permease